MVVNGKLADGSDLLAVPNYPRTNRYGAPTPHPPNGRPKRSATADFDRLG